MKSAIQEYIEQRNMTRAGRYNSMKQEREDQNCIVIDKRQVNEEVQKVVDEIVSQIVKPFKR